MKTFAFGRLTHGLTLSLCVAAGSLLIGTAAQAGPTGFALIEGDQLLQFDTDTPGSISRTLDVTGLAVDDTLAGIAFRPATPGQLYGVGNSNRVYVINTATGTAMPVSANAFADPATLSGTIAGFDFNPVADRIRVTTSDAENFRVHPETGALVSKDGALSYASGDVNEGEAPDITAIAYTNNAAGATTTRLLGIDSGFANLVEISPNDGTLHTIGPVQGDNTQLFSGFDIIGSGNTGFAASTAVFTGGQVSDPASLFHIDLTTGAATSIGAIGDGSSTLLGLAVADDGGTPNPIPLPPAAYAFPAAALIGLVVRQRMLKQAASH